MPDNQIQVLPKALCDQLAAGEVLERASSAIKELVENALDAGADDIEIEIENAGRDRLSVCDNGCGMTEEDAKMSILRHATSKIHSTDDLAAISTMGFRGEALASMAAVSRMTITTQRHEDETGTLIRVEGAEMTECRAAAAPPGTQIVLEDLFFNTPARLKFLKSPATETRRVYEVVEQFAIACHDVRWKLTVDGRVKCEYPRHRSLADRALAVFGRGLYEHLFPLEFTILGDVSVDGLFCAPDYTQSTAGRLYTYVNRRIVHDKTINSAVSQAYKEFLHGRKPCAVIFLTIPLDKIDVNVHPTKHEIRFETPDEVFRAVYRAVRRSLEKTPWIRSTSTAELPESAFRTPEDNLRRDYGIARNYPERPAFESRALEAPAPIDSRVARELEVFDAPPPDFEYHSAENADTAQNAFQYNNYAPDSDRRAFDEAFGTPSAGSFDDAHRFSGVNDACVEPPQRPEFHFERPAVQTSLELPPTVPGGICETEMPAAEASERDADPAAFGYFSHLRYIGQHDLTYLICADGENLVIIDQHAAHERINFERLKRVADDVLPAVSQGLLFPMLLNLDGRLSAVLSEYSEFFEKLGFQIDELGNNSHAIRAVPECLVDYDYAATIRDALLDLGDSGRASQFDDIRDHILATMACHKSIRAGQKLSPTEVAQLFRLMDETGFRSNCPHGRPVHFVLTIGELEKRFLRTGFVK